MVEALTLGIIYSLLVPCARTAHNRDWRSAGVSGKGKNEGSNCKHECSYLHDCHSERAAVIRVGWKEASQFVLYVMRDGLPPGLRSATIQVVCGPFPISPIIQIIKRTHDARNSLRHGQCADRNKFLSVHRSAPEP